MAQKSLYDVLLVDQNATLDEIKLAFKRRALQVHPDKGGSKEEFHLVYQALETLGDPAARQKYDHSLATASKKTEAAPHPKSRKRKRENKHAQPAASCKAETKTKPQTPGKTSTTFAGKAPSSSKPPRAAATAMPAEPQSKQTKLLMKIRDLLKRLPREVRNDVITNQFSQKQRVLLEKFMVDNAATSSGPKSHSEGKALAPVAGRSAPNRAEFDSETSPRETPQRMEDSSHGNCLVVSPATNSVQANLGRRFAHSMEKRRHPKKRTRRSFDAICNEPGHSATSSTMQVSDTQSLTSEGAETRAPPYQKESMQEMTFAMDVKHGTGYYSAVANSKHGRSPDIEMVSAKRPAKVKAQSKRKAFNTKARSSSGCVHRAGARSTLYTTRIRFDSIEMNTGNSFDLKTALDHLLILTSVKQKMRNHTGAGSFVERLQAAMVSSATEQGRNLADLKLSFLVCQSAGCFIGSNLRSPSVRSLEVFGKMRSVFEPFRQYAKNLGKQNVYWQFSPVHLEDAWERFQAAVARAWELAGVDSTAILQKIRSLYEAQAPFRSANLQRWEQQHMARQDKNGNRPWRLREKNPTGRLECLERRQMAMEDKNKHRPKKLRERNPSARLECWERRQMSLQDKNRHRPWRVRERNPTYRLECWERQQMAMEDKNQHRPKNMREKNHAARLECWERRRMAMQDKNKHRPRKMRQKSQICETPLYRQLFALKKLIARWGNLLKREAKLVDKERQRVLRQRKAWKKKDQEERRRVEVLKQKQQQEEERSRREWLRKRLRTDLTMDDILGQKDVGCSDWEQDGRS